MSAESERQEELAHGGITSVEGDVVTLGSGAQWWLNGSRWARDEANALMHHDRTLVSEFLRQRARS